MVDFRFLFYFQIVMISRKQPIFLSPNFQFENNFYFRFVSLRIMHDDLLCLPSWHNGNCVNCQGRIMEFYYQISVGTLQGLAMPG